jgi:hypothetical protein
MKFITLQSANRQKGMALMLAIGFLALLSILGATVLNVALRGLDESESRTFTKSDQMAFYAADRAVEYSMNRDIVVNLAQYNSINLTSDIVKRANGLSSGVTHQSVIDAAGPGSLVSGLVSDVGPRSLPPALAAAHGSEFGANMYHVSVKTKAGTGRLERETHVNASIVRLFKMDDDQIFRTSEGDLL